MYFIVGRSRSRSIDSRDSKIKVRSEVGQTYLDMMDIVNMTYEEYLEAYRFVILYYVLLCFVFILLL